MSLLETLFLLGFWLCLSAAALVILATRAPGRPTETLIVPASCEPVRFQATDGLWLCGWKLSKDPRHPWVMVCHGPQHTRAGLLGLAEELCATGLNTFLFDFRGHGESQGRVISYGWLERRDLEGALAFLGGQPEIPDHPYGIVADASAGLAALSVAAADDRLGALILLRPPRDPLDPLIGRLRGWLGLAPPIRPLASLMYRLRFGIRPTQLASASLAAQLTSRPMRMFNDWPTEKESLAEIPRFFRQYLGANSQATKATRY